MIELPNFTNCVGPGIGGGSTKLGLSLSSDIQFSTRELRSKCQTQD
jgi:hypothetical protein